MVVRAEPQVLKSEDLPWLTEAGVRVLATDRLHAKTYFNESKLVVSLMNLTEFSTKNSLELALVVNGTKAAHEIREYVSNTLIRLANPSRVRPGKRTGDGLEGLLPVRKELAGASAHAVKKIRTWTQLSTAELEMLRGVGPVG